MTKTGGVLGGIEDFSSAKPLLDQVW